MKNKTTDRELKKLLKKHSIQKIIYMHTELKINLTSKQLDQLIKLRNKGGQR